MGLIAFLVVAVVIVVVLSIKMDYNRNLGEWNGALLNYPMSVPTTAYRRPIPAPPNRQPAIQPNEDNLGLLEHVEMRASQLRHQP